MNLTPIIFLMLCCVQLVSGQHQFSVVDKQVIWERQFQTSEPDVREQLAKVKKVHFLQEDTGNVLNVKYPCPILFGTEVNFDFKFTIVTRDSSYLVSLREIRFEESEIDGAERAPFDNLVLRFNRKELSRSKAAQETLRCMDEFFTAFFKTALAVPQQ